MNRELFLIKKLDIGRGKWLMAVALGGMMILGVNFGVKEAPRPPLSSPPASSEPAGDNLKGIYLTSLSISNRKPADIISEMKEQGFNAVVINVKNADGVITYRSEVELASKIGAVRARLNLDELLDQFQRAGIYTIARQVIFKDPLMAKHLGLTGKWTTPDHQKVVRYNLELASEVSQRGFDEIQFDYVRFPDDGKIGADYSRRSELITNFVEQARAELSSDLPFSIDVYGRTLWKWNSKNNDPTGQNLEQLQDHVDYISPMIYPSHYTSPKLRDDPGYCVGEALRAGSERLSAKLRPYIQGFHRHVPSHLTTASYIAEQIKAVDEAKVNGFLVWNPKSNYDALWKAAG
ncbi:MAG: putative glycoside hydrolase [Candidatus Acetothermia bacterium]